MFCGHTTVVGRGILLIGQGLDGWAEGWAIGEEEDVEGFGGTRALFIPGIVSKNTPNLTLVMPE